MYENNHARKKAHTVGSPIVWTRKLDRSVNYGLSVNDGWAEWYPQYILVKMLILTNFMLGDANDMLATGVAKSTSVARFYFPINSYKFSTSITTAGTFEILNSNNAITETGVANTSLTLQGTDTPRRMVIIDVSGLTLTTGEHLVLRVNDSSASVTINF